MAQPSNTETQDLSTQAISSQEPSADTRYSKDAFIDIYKAQENSDTTSSQLLRLLSDSYNPGQSNGTNGRGGWGKSHDGRDNHGPYACWDASGSVQPIGLQEFTDDEKDVSFPLHVTLILLTVGRLSLATSTLH